MDLTVLNRRTTDVNHSQFVNDKKTASKITHADAIFVFGPRTDEEFLGELTEKLEYKSIDLDVEIWKGMTRQKIHDSRKAGRLGQHTHAFFSFHAGVSDTGQCGVLIDIVDKKEIMIPVTELIDWWRNTSSESLHEESAVEQKTWSGTMHFNFCHSGHMRLEILPGTQQWNQGHYILYTNKKELLGFVGEDTWRELVRYFEICKKQQHQPYIREVFEKVVSTHGDCTTLLGSSREGLDLTEAWIQHAPKTIASQSSKSEGPLLNIKAINTFWVRTVRGTSAQLKPMLEQFPELANLQRNDHSSPLHAACSNGNYEVVDFLISKGANQEATNLKGQTGLHLAAGYGHIKAVECLITNKVNRNAQDLEGRTALFWACLRNHYGAAEALIKHEVEINVGNIRGRTPLHVVCELGNLEIATLLSTHVKTNIEALDNNADRPLDMACMMGHLALVKLLLKKGASIEALQAQSTAPLARACQYGHLDMVKYLIQQGANAKAQEKKYGYAPIHDACAKGRVHVVEYLISLGAHKVVSRQGITPIQIAHCFKEFAIVELLEKT